MQSFKSRLVAIVLRHTRKKAFGSAAELNRWIARARLTETHRPPADVTSRLRITEQEINGCPVYEADAGGRSSGRILYLHGGGFVFEMSGYHWRLIAEIAERTGMRITVPAYPLAPEHRFDAIFGMALDTYRDMLCETPAEDIAFVGDSAGGNMAVVMTMMAAAEGLPVPSRHVLISAGLDFTLDNPEVMTAARLDPWLDIAGGLEAIRHYAPGIERSDWRISPIRGDLSVLPPMLILAGGLDLLTVDTIRFAELARQAGVEIDLVLEPRMVHVWPLIDMPEARRARDRIVAYLMDEGTSTTAATSRPKHSSSLSSATAST